MYSERKTSCRREHIFAGQLLSCICIRMPCIKIELATCIPCLIAFFLSAFVAIHTSYVKRSVMLNHTPLRISFEKEFSAGCQPRYPIKIPITTWKSFNDALTSRTLLFLFFYTQLSEKINPSRDFLIISKCPFSNIHKINLLFYGPPFLILIG